MTNHETSRNGIPEKQRAGASRDETVPFCPQFLGRSDGQLFDSDDPVISQRLTPTMTPTMTLPPTMTLMTTVQPAAHSATPTAWPIPLPPPVTIAVRMLFDIEWHLLAALQ